MQGFWDIHLISVVHIIAYYITETTIIAQLLRISESLINGQTLNTETEAINGIAWTYNVSGGEAIIGGGSYKAIPVSTSGVNTIPAILGGYPVTRINFKAFY